MRVTAYLNLNFQAGDYLERIDRAASAGVDGIECYGWDLGVEMDDQLGPPFAAEFDLEALVDRMNEHELEFVYLSGDRPPLTDPAQEAAAIESIERSLELADELGCSYVNVKAGRIQPGMTIESQRQQVVSVLRAIAPAAEAAQSTVLLEPINAIDTPHELVNTATDATSILDAVDSPGVRLLLDLFHEQLGSGNIVNTIRDTVPEYVEHIHAADAPLRSQPGTGELNWETVIDTLEDVGYDGYLGGEFIPSGNPDAALESFVSVAGST